jgi:hypothetical protein
MFGLYEIPQGSGAPRAALVVPALVLLLSLAGSARALSPVDDLSGFLMSPVRPTAAGYPAPLPGQSAVLTGTVQPAATAAGIMKQIADYNTQLKDFIDKGDFAEVWVPALGTKDVAIYLQDHLGELDATKRDVAQSAVARLERACWLLDAVGDLGNRPQIVDAYAQYTAALNDVQSFFPGK